jgi:hypothetical protein
VELKDEHEQKQGIPFAHGVDFVACLAGCTKENLKPRDSPTLLTLPASFVVTPSKTAALGCVASIRHVVVTLTTT